MKTSSISATDSVNCTAMCKHVSAFFLNNQPDAQIIQILFCNKTLHVSGNFSAHHQESPTVHSPLVSFMQVSLTTASKQNKNGTSSILTLLITLFAIAVIVVYFIHYY